MSQITSGARSVLSHPHIYNIFQQLMGASRTRREFVEKFVRPFANCRILDIGCGTAELLSFLPRETEYWGFDISQRYIGAARKRFGARGKFECAILDEGAISRLPKFDVVIASGLLHHLDDAEAKSLARIARTGLKDNGRLVTIDPCFTAGQNPVARLLIQRDRGRNVRTPETYRRLCEDVFPHVTGKLRNRRLIPYTHWIMECSA